MAFPYTLHALAVEEYVDAYEWYENEQPGLGERFIEALDECIHKLSLAPQHYSKIQGAYRQMKVSNFPYIIVYRYFPKKKCILISSVHHTSKHPRSKFRK